MDRPWWASTAVYQVYPRSFADGTGDGVGDLPGLTAHLDHIVDLGVGAIWLSPVYRSPMADFGYDISDHCAVDPLFGTTDDLIGLVEASHDRGLRVLLDWVPNHTSDEHPWFLEARSSRDSPKRDWYVWRDPAPDGGPPNNWIAAWGDVPAWTLDEVTGQYYLHCFLDRQPDLNWSHPAVVDAQLDVLRFWLDRGIDGFRADVVHLIGKDPEFGDDPPDVAGLPHVVLNDRPESHAHLRTIRSLLDSYDHEPMMVGEVFLFDVDAVAGYYGAADELHLSFNFAPLHAPWRAESWRRQVDAVTHSIEGAGGWPTWALANHDVVRIGSRLGGSQHKARAAAVLQLMLRGTPFIYAGDELGLLDAVVPESGRVDPGGRDGCRAPLPWRAEPPHGWSGATPWLPFPPDPSTMSVESQRNDPSSMLALYQSLLRLRRSFPALQVGEQDVLDGPVGVLVWRRWVDGSADSFTVAVNFTPDVVPFADLPRAGAVVVRSDADATGFALRPWEAAVFRTTGPTDA